MGLDYKQCLSFLNSLLRYELQDLVKEVRLKQTVVHTEKKTLASFERKEDNNN